MQHTLLHPIFKNNSTPVIVCRNASGYPVIYANPSAILFFYQRINTESIKITEANILLEDLLDPKNKQALYVMMQTMMTEGRMSGFMMQVCPAGGDPVAISVSGNQMEGAGDTFILYINEHSEAMLADDETVGAISANAVISVVLNESVHALDNHEAISKILCIVGQYLDVSRSYIFEDLFNEYTRNTYEWCNDGVEPAIQELQSLKKSDYNYGQIVSVGKFIYDDIVEVPDGWGREVLEMQNIKAIAILTLYRGGQAIGYVGFDDCRQSRKWTRYEIQVLEQVSNILVSLIEQREIRDKEKQNLEVLRTVSDHFDQIIYASDIHTHEVLFVNRCLADTLGKDVEEIIGRHCWEVLQRNSEQCSFCPLNKMLDGDGNIMKHEYVWEWENPLYHRWFRVRDSIIKWFDGREVHLEIATDITDQKKYEKKLEHYASTDAMTGLLNREWGYHEIQALIKQKQDRAMCLCFIDVDGLKNTNDTLGHDAGDEMLVNIVDTIRESIRSSDIMCRWGGDEFLVLMNCNGEQAEQLMQRVVVKLDQANRSNQHAFVLSISYGLVSVGEGSSRYIDELVATADSRMYDQKMAKRKGITAEN